MLSLRHSIVVVPTNSIELLLLRFIVIDTPPPLNAIKYHVSQYLVHTVVGFEHWGSLPGWWMLPKGHHWAQWHCQGWYRIPHSEKFLRGSIFTFRQSLTFCRSVQLCHYVHVQTHLFRRPNFCSSGNNHKNHENWTHQKFPTIVLQLQMPSHP